ncbi:MAG: autophagy protein 13 [Sclerophora amabilis]|nr:MAG: autophagy protein 13 [Sclerophora amabilis]
MHQHPRTPPVTASPASSPWTNPTRTNNPRDQSSQDRPRSDSDFGAYGERDAPAADNGDGAQGGFQGHPPVGQAKEAKARLSQIIQNFFIKAALIIIQSRMICPPSYNKGTGVRRVNKWFNVEIDETDIFREDWRLWKTCEAEEKRPPPMIIETYLEAAGLTNSQTLVAIDDQGKRWNVVDALNASNASNVRGTSRAKKTQVILERWAIELGDVPLEQPADLNGILPIVYKKSIVLFRSLFTYSKFLPSWKFARRLAKLRTNHSALRVNCRMINGDDLDLSPDSDALSTPLFDDNHRVTEDFSFGSTDSPAGSFSVKVTYRSSCEFRVDDSEALLSSHFMGVDEHFFRPSLGAPEDRQLPYLGAGKEVGSLPPSRKGAVDQPDRAQAYGSLSTFHQVGPAAGSSPLSALRAARDLGPDSPSPPLRVPPNHRSTQGSRSSLRSTEGAPGMQRRTSVSFQPFKSPSLSASPSPAYQATTPSSPRNSIGRTPPASVLAQARLRTSVELQAPSSLRAHSTVPETAVATSGSASPKPAPITRYSSSFGHRRGRLSSGGGSNSKTEDDNNSSGKGSLASSSAQPGSGILTEGTAGGSSGSIQTDDENISDFLKMLDTKKNLKSFEASNDAANAEASTRRTSAALSKFQRMRESNAALSDSMSSSVMLHRSSSSSSRQLSSVPPMVAGTSMSTSSSPGKPISPHTPHTPAIPSRLSANSIVVDQARSRVDGSSDVRRQSSRNRRSSRREDMIVSDGTNAIDIPASPRLYHPHNRRSSSVAQQHRAIPVEDETGDLLPFGIRSASLGAEDRPPLSLSALLRLQESSEAALPPSGSCEQALQTPAGPTNESIDMSRQRSSSFGSREEGPQLPRNSQPGSTNPPYRPRFGRQVGTRGLTPPQGSLTSLTGDRGSVSGTSERPAGGRYSFTRAHNFDEDDLLFAMSDLHFQGRRSLEEGRGGSSSGTSERGGGGGGGGTNSASNSGRGSGNRRGGGGLS